MAKISTIVLKGASGKTYEFHVYPINEECPDESGVYAFNKRYSKDNSYSHDVKYIGKAESFQNRFYSHDGKECAIKAGANVVCLKWIKNGQERTAIEIDLIKNYNPTCNTHHTS